jgi:hypothetical protein
MLGSVEGIRGNAYAPLTSDAAPMTTVDGSRSFGAQIQCPSSSAFVTVLLTPAGGGEARITVGEDLDFDGVAEYTFTSPVKASGVCANGIISCRPGTWESCRGNRWSADAAGRIGLVEVSISDLGGCYCINNSCGGNLLVARTGQILESVGGGVIGAIQGLSPGFTVTRVTIDGTSIRYHGQATSGCPAAGAHGNCGGPFPGEAPIGSGGWHTLQTVTLPAAGGRTRLTGASFSMRNINGPGCATGAAHLNAMTQGFDVSLSTGAVCPAAGAQFPAFTWGYLFEMKEDAYQEEVNDGCAALAAEPGCSLREETVDGVLTYSDFMPTFITPVTTCKTFHGSFSVFPECREWWRKERVYHCATGGRWDFSDARKRADRVAGTATDNLTTMTYQDLRKGNGGWLTEDRSTALNTPREDYTGPILACKTRRPRRKTDAALAGNASQYLSNPDGWDFLYRKCDHGRCPADIAGGEEILIDCRVINEFAEAATVMNVLEQANKDMICSDGVKR